MSKARQLGELEASEASSYLATQGRRNLIINGGFDVWQRGDSFTVANEQVYTADRFKVHHNVSAGEVVISKGEGKVGGQRSLNYEVTSAVDLTLETNSWGLIQTRLEQGNCKKVVFGKSDEKFSVSFLAKTNVPGSYTVTVNAYQTTANSAANRILIGKEFTINSSDVYEEITLTFDKNTVYDWKQDVDRSIEGLDLSIVLDATPDRVTLSDGTWEDPNEEIRSATMVSNSNQFLNSVGNYFEVTEIQLELGDTATPFEVRSYGEELALCQRYYQKFGGRGSNYNLCTAYCRTSTRALGPISLPTAMRAIGSYSVSSIPDIAVLYKLSKVNAASLNSGDLETDVLFIDVELASGAFTSGEAAVILLENNAYLEIDAEL